jgi:muramoyltetrapeptide carboxypeptidase LdcA involved in peptidoglycan recycling
MPKFSYPAKPVRGDSVAVLSPSGRSAALFPAPVEVGLTRLRKDFGLVPVEYPTTRAARATPAERAADIHAAFADPQIKAVIATIGGDDQLKVLKHLDPDLLVANPKPFFGYSDNINLLLYLWNLGLVSYHGGALMVQFGRPGAIHPVTRHTLQLALLGGGPEQLTEPAEYTDEDDDWADQATFAREPAMHPSAGWSWHGPQVAVSGPAWGGCLEIIDFQLRTGSYLLARDEYDGAILFAETSEEMPDAEYVYRVLMCMGERGLLQRFGAVVWGRPKAWSFGQRRSGAEKADYTAAQQTAVLRAIREYAPAAPVVFGVDFGHTDPQLIIPFGGNTTVDSINRTITVTY